MSTKKLKSCLVGLSVLLLGGVVGLPMPVRALSGLSFTPAFLRIDVPTGSVVQDSAIVVKNNSIVEVTLHARAVDVDSTSSNLMPLTTTNSAATKAVTVRNPDLTLLPGQSVNVLIRVNATHLPAGGQFTSVEIKQLANPTKKGLPINQAASIGVFIVKEEGVIRTLRLNTHLPGGLITRIPTAVPLNFYADGNVSLVPRAAVTVKEGDEVIAKATINDLSMAIQPQSQLAFKPVLTYQKPISPGRHIVSVMYRYDGQQDPIVVESTFWYVPIWYLFILAAGVAALGLLWWHHRRQPLPKPNSNTETESESIFHKTI